MKIKITLNGAVCAKETWDNMVEHDGKGDEVFFTWGASFKGAPRAQPPARMSNVYGDTNGYPNRTQAGSRSDRGGIKSGDLVPLRVAWLKTPPFPFPLPTILPPWSAEASQGFPHTLWEGDLAAGDAVAITPLIWEWDGVNANPGPTLTIVNNIVVAVTNAIGIAVPVVGAIGAVVGAVVGAIAANLGMAQDRPIGHDPRKPGDSANIAWPAVVVEEATALALIGTDSGYGPGIIECIQRDPADMGGGVYRFFVQVAKA